MTKRSANRSNVGTQLRIQRCISRISSRFVGGGDFDRSINASLADIGRLSGADRAYLFVLSSGGRKMDNMHEWCAAGVKPQIANLQGLSTAMFPWWMRKLRRGETLHIRDVNALPRTATAEKEILQSQDIKSLIVFPVSVRGRLKGFVGFDNVVKMGSWGTRDIELLRVSAGILGDALEHRRTDKLLRDKQTRLAASRKELKALTMKVLTAREEEAGRIAADLHDEGGSFAVVMGVALNGIAMDIREKNWAHAERAVAKSRETLKKYITQLKVIAVELRPPALQVVGLDGALRHFFSEVETRTALRIYLTFRGRASLVREEVAIIIFRVVQEAVTNAVKHAEAENVRVDIAVAGGRVCVSVRDDGKGFDIPPAHVLAGGIGQRIMRERVESLGGKLEIKSSKGKGTEVCFRISIDKKGPHGAKRSHRG